MTNEMIVFLRKTETRYELLDGGDALHKGPANEPGV